MKECLKTSIPSDVAAPSHLLKLQHNHANRISVIWNG